MNEQITITFPDNLDIYCFEVTKRDYDGNVVWSEQADTLSEAMSEIAKHEFHRGQPYPKKESQDETQG